MKLDTKRTVLVGFAFLSICAFWQMYDNLIPLILTNTFHLNETISGAIMAADNVLALFLLPLFGGLSDKCKSRLGRRRPYILFGTLAAVALMLGLPLLADSYHAAPAPGKLAAFIGILGLLLVAMGTYRSPAVALMPDVTPKPLRSKANAIINLMGALGGVYTLAMTSFLVKGSAVDDPSYLPLFIAVAALMAISVTALALSVNEKKLKAEADIINDRIDAETVAKLDLSGNEGRRLSPEMFRSLMLILFSVSFWYMGYNAVTTAFTRYATEMWGQDVGGASTCLMIATVGAVISYIPIGMISSKIGRKKTILIGVALLAGCFALGALMAATFSPLLYVMFALVGFAWAAINVNSYPMVVEISTSCDVGKYTGYYYTFSMAAQIATPIISGQLLQHVGYNTLFPYAAIMVSISFITMSLTRHGDSRPEKKGKLESFDIED